MHRFVWFDRQILSASDADLPAISSAGFYGKGVFTSVPIFNSRPFLWDQHWIRLVENAKKLGIPLAEFSKSSVERSLAEIIEKNSVINGRSRLTFFDERPSKIWPLESREDTTFLITTGDIRRLSVERLGVSHFRVNSTSPLVNIKSCNYLENILSLQEVNDRGYDEGVRINENGEVVSACLANIFWIRNEEIFTPSLATGSLAGTTRGLILDNFSVKEVRSPLADLTGCDEIFLTSAGIGIKRISTFDNKTFKRSDLFIKIRSFFNDRAARN